MGGGEGGRHNLSLPFEQIKQGRSMAVNSHFRRAATERVGQPRLLKLLKSPWEVAARLGWLAERGGEKARGGTGYCIPEEEGVHVHKKNFSNLL